jgi:H+/Cl- antiporter ClcA
VLGYRPVYKIPALHVTSLWELPLFLLMGLLLGVLAPLFMGLLDGTRRLAKRLPLRFAFGQESVFSSILRHLAIDQCSGDT